MKLVDVDGNDLYVGGDKNLAFSYIQSLFNSDVASRLTMDDNGKVSFNTEGLDIGSDAANELIDNLVNQTDKRILFEVADQTTGIARNSGPKYNKGDIVDYNFNGEDNRTGMVNLSESARNIDGGTGNPDQLPKQGFNGQVTFGTGKWTHAFVKGAYTPIEEIVFHELAENYNRTVKKQPYMRKDGSGAHQASIDASKNFKKQFTKQAGWVGKYETP